jgi:hypothetical protein
MLPQLVQGPGHLLGILPCRKLGFLQQANPANQMLEHFLASGVVLAATTPGFLQGSPLLLQLTLCPAQFFQPLLGLQDLDLQFLAVGWTRRGRRCRRGQSCAAGRLEFGIDEIGLVSVGRHRADYRRRLAGIQMRSLRLGNCGSTVVLRARARRVPAGSGRRG